jgi:hypothetical protein
VQYNYITRAVQARLVREELMKTDSPKDAALALARRAYRDRSMDDISVVVLLLNWRSDEESTPRSGTCGTTEHSAAPSRIIDDDTGTPASRQAVAASTASLAASSLTVSDTTGWISDSAPSDAQVIATSLTTRLSQPSVLLAPNDMVVLRTGNRELYGMSPCSLASDVVKQGSAAALDAVLKVAVSSSGAKDEDQCPDAMQTGKMPPVVGSALRDSRTGAEVMIVRTGSSTADSLDVTAMHMQLSRDDRKPSSQCRVQSALEYGAGVPTIGDQTVGAGKGHASACRAVDEKTQRFAKLRHIWRVVKRRLACCTRASATRQ